MILNEAVFPMLPLPHYRKALSPLVVRSVRIKFRNTQFHVYN